MVIVAGFCLLVKCICHSPFVSCFHHHHLLSVLNVRSNYPPTRAPCQNLQTFLSLSYSKQPRKSLHYKMQNWYRPFALTYQIKKIGYAILSNFNNYNCNLCLPRIDIYFVISIIYLIYIYTYIYIYIYIYIY